jgi:hypothetical protein
MHANQGVNRGKLSLKKNQMIREAPQLFWDWQCFAILESFDKPDSVGESTAICVKDTLIMGCEFAVNRTLSWTSSLEFRFLLVPTNHLDIFLRYPCC